MYQRIVISIIVIFYFCIMPKQGYVAPIVLDGFSVVVSGFPTNCSNLLYPLYHANIFHLLGNLLCLWLFRCSLNLPISYAIAVLCTFLPTFTTEPTMGLSGVLFAIAGISWGQTGRFYDMCRKCLPFILITILIPHVNALIHVYCLFLGYLYGTLKLKDPLTTVDPYNASWVDYIDQKVNSCAKK